MNIITIDTTLDNLYLSLSKGSNKDTEVLDTKIIQSTKEKYHSAFIITSLVELLKENDLTPKEIEAIGVNIGPGSFTGIRVGITVARIIGQSLDIPVVGVPSLEVLSRLNPTNKQTLVLMDARKNKAYTGIYNNEQILLEPCAMELEQAIQKAKEDYFVVTDNKMLEILSEQNIECLNYVENNSTLALNLAQITIEKLAKTTEHKWVNIKPLYIQPPPVFS